GFAARLGQRLALFHGHERGDPVDPLAQQPRRLVQDGAALVGGHLPPLPKTRIRGRERGIQISLASLGVVADGRAISWVDDGHRGAACSCLPLAIDQQGYIGVSWACCCHVHLLWWSRNNASQYEWRCSAGADFAVAARLRDRMLTM